MSRCEQRFPLTGKMSSWLEMVAGWGGEGGGRGFGLAEMSETRGLIGCLGIMGLVVGASVQRQYQQSLLQQGKWEKKDLWTMLNYGTLRVLKCNGASLLDLAPPASFF